MKKFIFLLLLVGGASYGYYGLQTTEFVPEISTVPLTRGNIIDTVGATGGLEAVTTVQVGSQVSGIIEALYADFNSIVHAGEVIARLEPSLFETQIEQSRANLERAEADVDRLLVMLEDAEIQLKRSQELASKSLISTIELEAAQVAVRSAAAQFKSSQASMTQSLASLHQTEVNLGHTVITAPIDGIVIARQVDVGQTVAASMSAPELFIIAADLTKMRVIANIDESDVGRIRPGQRVRFGVDAYPTEEFEGTVSQIRLEPVIQQNVVTYATVIDVPNNELKLKPGMTATVTLEIERRENGLRIPNSALRFRPTPDMFAALNQPAPDIFRPGNSRSRASIQSIGPRRSTSVEISDTERQQRRERIQNMTPKQRAEFFAARGDRGSGRGRTAGHGLPPRRSDRGAEITVPAVERGATTIDALFAPLEITETDGRVWMLDGDQLLPVEVRLGITDGTTTELLRVRGGGRRARPRPDPQIAELRQQIEAIKDPEARQNLERMLERLEGDSDAAAPVAPPPTLAALDEGARLVTDITTPDEGTSARSSGGGSPLIPQFGRRRR